MAALRSSLPSRLRQLLSGETAVGPSIRLDSEAVSPSHQSINLNSGTCSLSKFIYLLNFLPICYVGPFGKMNLGLLGNL